MRARRQHPRRLPLQLSAARLPRRRCHERRLLRRLLRCLRTVGPPGSTPHTLACVARARWRIGGCVRSRKFCVLPRRLSPSASWWSFVWLVASAVVPGKNKRRARLTLCLLLCSTIGLTTMSPLARHCLQAAHRSTDIRKRLRVGDRRHGRRSAGRRAASHVLLPPPWRRLLCSAGEQGLWLT